MLKDKIQGEIIRDFNVVLELSESDKLFKIESKK